MQANRRPWYRNPLFLAIGLSSLLYFVLAIRFALRIALYYLNPSTRFYFVGVLGTTVVLYVVATVISVSERHRAGAGIPILGSALFGSFVCIVFYGP